MMTIISGIGWWEVIYEGGRVWIPSLATFTAVLGFHLWSKVRHSEERLSEERT